MKPLIVTAVLLTLAPLSAAHADHSIHMPCISSSCCDSPARWAPRHDLRRARLAITTENGESVLLLTDEVVAVQLSDHVMNKLSHKLHEEDADDDDGRLGHVIKAAVLEGIHSLLNHSAELSIDDIDDVAYRNGRLVITTDSGGHPFQDVEVDNQPVLESFSPSDARAFEKAFHKVAHRRWR